jgi:hypothetical protein
VARALVLMAVASVFQIPRIPVTLMYLVHYR